MQEWFDGLVWSLSLLGFVAAGASTGEMRGRRGSPYHREPWTHTGSAIG